MIIHVYYETQENKLKKHYCKPSLSVINGFTVNE